MTEHKINNMCDFLNCENPDCIYSATWSLGHICDHCKLHKCMCPCPLTKEWLKENSDKIKIQRLRDMLEMDIASFKYLIDEHNKKDHKGCKCYCDEIRPEKVVIETIQRYLNRLDEKIPKYD